MKTKTKKERFVILNTADDVFTICNSHAEVKAEIESMSSEDGWDAEFVEDYIEVYAIAKKPVAMGVSTGGVTVNF